MTFADCRSLKEIEIPSSVEIVHESSFWNTISLEKIILNSFKQVYQEGLENKCVSELRNYYINEKTNQILLLKEQEDIEGIKKIDYEYFWYSRDNCSIGEAITLSLAFPREVFSNLGNTKYTLTRMARFINETDLVDQIKTANFFTEASIIDTKTKLIIGIKVELSI